MKKIIACRLTGAALRDFIFSTTQWKFPLAFRNFFPSDNFHLIWQKFNWRALLFNNIAVHSNINDTDSY